MRVSSAQLPPGGGEDKIITSGSYVIMLDGASAFTPVPVPAAYAAQLGDHIARRLDAHPGRELGGVLAEAIENTAGDLDLQPGCSPSSTVIIFRQAGDDADCLVLGDSLAILAGRAITDDRLSRIRPDLRQHYRERLAEGHGYDSEHHRILAELQAEQARRRNQPGGYWIAETDPRAADHAITVSLPADALPWAMLATDGAYKTMSYLGLADWPALGLCLGRPGPRAPGPRLSPATGQSGSSSRHPARASRSADSRCPGRDWVRERASRPRVGCAPAGPGRLHPARDYQPSTGAVKGSKILGRAPPARAHLHAH